MRKNLLSAILATAALSVMLLIPAKTQAMGFLYKPAPGSVTYVPYTNYVTIVSTNSAGQQVTNSVPQVGQKEQVTAYAINPAITGAVQTANQLVGFLPAPWGNLAGLATGGIIALLGLGLNAKNGKLNTANSIISATVAGVEAANDAATKSSIQSHAMAAGVQADLHAIVSDMTGSNTTPGQIVGTAPKS